jgi:hypothetical protein
MKQVKADDGSHERLNERVEELKSVIEKLHKHGDMIKHQREKLATVVCGMEKMLTAYMPAE